MAESYRNKDGDNVRIESDRIFISEPLRNRVWDKCNSRCTKCGCTAQEAKDKGEELQLNHIIPFKDGGKTEYDNLDLNCTSCNIQGREDNKPKVQAELHYIPAHRLSRPGEGKPRKYNSPEDLYNVGREYIDACLQSNKPPLTTGLAIALGFASRQALINYEGYSKEYYDAIKRLKLEVEEYREGKLYSPMCAGAIFGLKNDGWSDKSEVTVSDPEGKALPPATFVFNMPDGSKLNAQQVAAQQANKPEST